MIEKEHSEQQKFHLKMVEEILRNCVLLGDNNLHINVYEKNVALPSEMSVQSIVKSCVNAHRNVFLSQSKLEGAIQLRYKLELGLRSV